jgi:phage terminase large subunit-like protein
VTDPEELRRTLEALEALNARRIFARFYYFDPHPKQREHLAKGRLKRERLLMAGNRQGKTETGAFEAACHLTGEYPAWWEGYKSLKPTIGWVAGETSLAVRDVLQKKLCGDPGVEPAFGSGMIPRDRLVDKTLARHGVADAFDTIQVKHASGGVSIARFKSYEQGRQKFQAEGLDWMWFDEEPKLDIYSEGLARIGERDGRLWMTFTPLQGRSAVVMRYLDEPSEDRAVTVMTIDDALHIRPEVRERMIAGYLPHEREARTRGVPTLGSGRIFMTPEEGITEARITDVPAYWKKIWGIDIGIGHPFAAVLLLWDADGDILHVHHTIRMADALPILHASAMRPVGLQVPVAWPKDAGDRDRGTGEPISKLYKAQGLKMLDQHAHWPDGHGGHSMSTEAGLLEWDERERTGRLKVASHLSDWLEERRFYHRKDGQIVKIKDDLLSATRIGIMMKRFARAVQLGGMADAQRTGPTRHFARGSANHPDGAYDVFSV